MKQILFQRVIDGFTAAVTQNETVLQDLYDPAYRMAMSRFLHYKPHITYSLFELLFFHANYWYWHLYDDVALKEYVKIRDIMFRRFHRARLVPSRQFYYELRDLLLEKQLIRETTTRIRGLKSKTNYEVID